MARSTYACVAWKGGRMLDISNVIKVHCYVISMLDKFIISKYVAESITDCRTFQSHRPLSAAYKTTGPERPHSSFKFATHAQGQSA